MGRRYVRLFVQCYENDLEHRINNWCENNNAEPVCVSVSMLDRNFPKQIVALVVMEEKDDVI